MALLLLLLLLSFCMYTSQVLNITLLSYRHIHIVNFLFDGHRLNEYSPPHISTHTRTYQHTHIISLKNDHLKINKKYVEMLQMLNDKCLLFRKLGLVLMLLLLLFESVILRKVIDITDVGKFIFTP